MAHKIRPNSYRLGINLDWSSRWFLNKKKTARLLEEDMAIRRVIKERLINAGIDKIDIERNSAHCRIFIKVAKPGLVIGKGGKGIEDLIAAIQAIIGKLARKYRDVSFVKSSISINVEEVRQNEISAQVVAQQIAWDLEKRLPVRRTMKKHLDLIMQNRIAQGAKIKLSGRLGGAEIARREWLAKGRLPLTTLRANIDYGEATTFATYGTVGIKVWIYKGEYNNA